MFFYAHPMDQPQSDLEQHLSKTANLAQMLVKGLGIEKIAYYAGLTHDLGKLNPYYQELFGTTERERWVVEQNLKEKYARLHSVFSALAAYSLFRNLSAADRAKVVCAVAAHHSGLLPIHKVFSSFNSVDDRFKRSIDGFFCNLYLFSNNNSLSLEWDRLLKNRKIPQLNFFVADKQSYIREYLDFCTIFSALVLADRGSFFDILSESRPKYALRFNTDVLARQSKLAHLRTAFQKSVLAENSFGERVMVLKAPTGIGKTKMFLDIINVISCHEPLDRVFYFSPLLALTEDFESKLEQVIDHDSMSKVLVYNHAFTGSLVERKNGFSELADDLFTDDLFKSKEYFERESFNYEFIVTTTQRLLMTLYSNRSREKMKLISFRNSFLIIDEVQTIPKFLLPNLVSLLNAMAERYNARILFVSATIPEALCTLPILRCSRETEEAYLDATLKNIQYLQELDVEDVAAQPARVLLMVNTRRKAYALYNQISKFRDGVVYLSAGITKKQRRETVRAINNEESVLVVSTQVLEAGVDISFDRIYREVAPLDSIVQTMGRLNREGKSKVAPLLIVFNLDEDTSPYDNLEMKLSKRVLPKVSNSKELYMSLKSYYGELAKAHATNAKMSENLESKMCRLLFDEVWDFVKENVLPVDVGDTVFIPSESEWENVKDALLKGKIAHRRFAEYTAELPRAFVDLNKKHNLLGMFDADLIQKEILLPKKEHLFDVYDPKVGLDKWTLPISS